MAEAWRNLTAVGARPLAITDNMNFGNPEKPEIMGQFAAAIRGMAAACRALDFPVVSGNVSLYNETEGRAILPTPAIGGLGVLDDAAQAVGIALRPGLDLVLVGATAGLARPVALAARDRRAEDGPPPPVDLAGRAAHRRFRARADPGRRGRAPATTSPMAACWWRSPRWRWPAGVGVRLLAGPARTCPAHAFWFGEDQGRYVLAVADAAALIARRRGGRGAGDALGDSGGAGFDTSRWANNIRDRVARAHERFLPAWMDERRPSIDGSIRMAMAASEIEALIKAALPDARVTVEDLAGDGDHYAATVVSEAFRGKSARAAAPDRLRRPARPHGRRAARARPANLGPRIRTLTR